MIAMVTRTQPIQDYMFSKHGGAIILDPSAPRDVQGNTLITEQVGIDATIKTPERTAEFPKVPRPSREAMDSISKKVAHLFR